MCLSSVTSVEKEKMPRGEYKIGWKSVELSKKGEKWYFDSMYNPLTLCNKWLRCTQKFHISIGSYREKYPTGFHIFETRAGARWWRGIDTYEKVVKVKYRRVVAVQRM